ncbi:MAG: hypothetical protein ACYCYP_08610 [Leptospirales bacterium]
MDGRWTRFLFRNRVAILNYNHGRDGNNWNNHGRERSRSIHVTTQGKISNWNQLDQLELEVPEKIE